MKIIILCILLMIFPISSKAQFIGIRIGIPQLSPQGTTTGGGSNGAGGSCGGYNNAMTFNGNCMTFNGAYMTFTHA